PGTERPNVANVVLTPEHTNEGGSQFTSGVHRAAGILLKSDYEQTAPVADDGDNLVGRFVAIDWTAVVSDEGLGFGPIVGKGHYGPPGMFDVKGHVQIGRDQQILAFMPILAVDALKVSNVPGQDRVMVPSWGYGFAELWVADDGKVTLQRTDIN